MSQFPSINNVNPGAVLDYVNSVGALQNPTRFRVTIFRKTGEKGEFLCDMAGIPSKKLRMWEDYMTGVISPLPVVFGQRMTTNVFQFVIEDTWISRKFFEDWQRSCFVDAGNKSTMSANKVKYLEDIGGEIWIFPLGHVGDGGKAEDVTYYHMYDCIPLEIIPTKMDASALNQTLKFAVNIYFSNYYTPGVST